MNPRFILLTALIVVAAASRLVPHPWNFAPITAIALLGGACFARRWHAFALCLAALALSDAALALRPENPGFYPEMPFVYAALALSVALGTLLRRRRRLLPIAATSLAASCQFFLLTNLGVWLVTDFYPRTADGLVQCYTLALPFFRNALAADLVFTVLLFGLYALAERLAIRPAPGAANPAV